MPTHRIFGVVRVNGRPAARRIDVVGAAAWGSGGLASGIAASVVSDSETGAWEAELEGDDLVWVMGAPDGAYSPLFLGPYRPVPIEM